MKLMRLVLSSLLALTLALPAGAADFIVRDRSLTHAAHLEVMRLIRKVNAGTATPADIRSYRLLLGGIALAEYRDPPSGAPDAPSIGGFTPTPGNTGIVTPAGGRAFPAAVSETVTVTKLAEFLRDGVLQKPWSVVGVVSGAHRNARAEQRYVTRDELFGFHFTANGAVAGDSFTFTVAASRSPNDEADRIRATGRRTLRTELGW